MEVRIQPSARYNIDDDLEEKIGSIEQMISNLRSAFLKEDFDRVEEALISRETKLFLEVKKLKDENALLEEKHQLDQSEKLKLEEERYVANKRYEKLLEEVKKGMDNDDKGEIFELRRKNEELEDEVMRLKALLEHKCKKLEGGILRLEEDTAKMMDESRRISMKMERSDSGEMFVNGSINNHSENGPMETGAQSSPMRDRSLSQGNGDDHTSGLRKSPPRDTIVIIDSDGDSACGDSGLKKPSEKPKDNDSLSLTSVRKKPMGFKRKRALSSSDNENDGDNFGQEFTPTSEMKLHLKSSLEPSVASDTNDPRSCDTLISRQDVEKSGGKQKPQSFLTALSEMGEDWITCDSSNSTSSSSDPDDDDLAQIVCKKPQEAEESKARGNHQSAVDSRE